MPAWHLRLRQGLALLRARPEPDETTITDRWLTSAQRAAFSRLPPHDRRHLVRVARELAHRAPDNHDLVVAGLLHDLGKADGSSRARLSDRAIKVVLTRISPRLLAWLARPERARFRRGLVLAVHHPALGAAVAERLGCSERTIWLIKHHEDANLDDPDLALLIAVDRVTP